MSATIEAREAWCRRTVAADGRVSAAEITRLGMPPATLAELAEWGTMAAEDTLGHAAAFGLAGPEAWGSTLTVAELATVYMAAHLDERREAEEAAS